MDELADLKHKLTDILCQIDLLGICDISTEYDLEARDIAERVVLKREKLSQFMLREVFEKWFGRDCCTEEEYAATYRVISKSLAEPGTNPRQLYQAIIEESE